MGLLKDRYEKHGTAENPLWLIVLSDLMTNLMLFFLIMYVFNLQPDLAAKAAFMDGFDKDHAEKIKENKAETTLKKFKEEDAAKKLAEELKKAGLQDSAEVQLTEKLIKINIAAPVLFASGEAGLRGDSYAILETLATVLARLPNEIIVEGHTDSVPVHLGPYATNWELSAARADAVVEMLASKHGVPQERLTAAAYGQYRPIATNDTKEGRAKNRRIEIIISRK